MKKLFLIFSFAFMAILFNACLAKNVNEIKYYELGLDFMPKNCANFDENFKISPKTSQKISLKLRPVTASQNLQTNDILIKSKSLELFSLDDARFTTSPAQMLENTLIKALSSDCDINLNQNFAQNSLLVKILEFYATSQNATITATLWLNEKAILLSQSAPIKSNSNDEIIKAMDIAMQELTKQILMIIKNN